ncbi:MAG TPA: phosphatase PAP2 family protein [Actinophytocola sp.]|nr:phosphatase PAP2 family protein [Actinophytocola sp.]
MWERVNRAEAALIADTRWLPARQPNAAVIAVTTAGRGGVLWLLWIAVEALRPGGDGGWAARAAAAVGAALVASQLVKRLVPARHRPEAPGGPARRNLPERPDSPSFPSSHAATAAAFTTALALRDPRLGLLVTPLTATATYGRLRTRVHWPTDLAAGASIGVAAALAVHGLPR